MPWKVLATLNLLWLHKSWTDNPHVSHNISWIIMQFKLFHDGNILYQQWLISNHFNSQMSLYDPFTCRSDFVQIISAGIFQKKLRYANNYRLWVQFLTMLSGSIVLSIWHPREVGKLFDWNLRVLNFLNVILRWLRGSKMLVDSNSSPHSKVTMNRSLWCLHRTLMVLKWRSESC